MIQWLENTTVALWVSESLWGYPLMLALHVTGLACVAGTFILLDLGLLRVIRGIDPSTLRSAFKLGWYGLILNVASGSLLFSSQASTFVQNTPFLVKMSLMSAAALITAYLHFLVSRGMTPTEKPSATPNLALVAAVSLVCWCSTIVAGRLIAYF